MRDKKSRGGQADYDLLDELNEEPIRLSAELLAFS